MSNSLQAFLIIATAIAAILVALTIVDLIKIHKIKKSGGDYNTYKSKRGLNLASWITSLYTVLIGLITSIFSASRKIKLKTAKHVDIICLISRTQILAFLLIITIIVSYLGSAVSNMGGVLSWLLDSDKDCICYVQCTGDYKDDNVSTYELIFGPEYFTNFYLIAEEALPKNGATLMSNLVAASETYSGFTHDEGKAEDKNIYTGKDGETIVDDGSEGIDGGVSNESSDETSSSSETSDETSSSSETSDESSSETSDESSSETSKDSAVQVPETPGDGPEFSTGSTTDTTVVNTDGTVTSGGTSGGTFSTALYYYDEAGTIHFNLNQNLDDYASTADNVKINSGLGRQIDDILIYVLNQNNKYSSRMLNTYRLACKETGFKISGTGDRTTMSDNDLMSDLKTLLADYKVGGRNPNCDSCKNADDDSLAFKCRGVHKYVKGWEWEKQWDFGRSLNDLLDDNDNTNNEATSEAYQKGNAVGPNIITLSDGSSWYWYHQRTENCHWNIQDPQVGNTGRFVLLNHSNIGNEIGSNNVFSYTNDLSVTSNASAATASQGTTVNSKSAGELGAIKDTYNKNHSNDVMTTNIKSYGVNSQFTLRPYSFDVNFANVIDRNSLPKDANGYTGLDVVQYASQFIDCNYIYGGTTLVRCDPRAQSGVDCSGFTMLVYQKFGYSLQHNSDSQANAAKYIGKDLTKAYPGDLIIYPNHVALYVGNGFIINASTNGVGIIYSKADARSDMRGIYRIITEGSKGTGSVDTAAISASTKAATSTGVASTGSNGATSNSGKTYVTHITTGVSISQDQGMAWRGCSIYSLAIAVSNVLGREITPLDIIRDALDGTIYQDSRSGLYYTTLTTAKNGVGTYEAGGMSSNKHKVAELLQNTYGSDGIRTQAYDSLPSEQELKDILDDNGVYWVAVSGTKTPWEWYGSGGGHYMVIYNYKETDSGTKFYVLTPANFGNSFGHTDNCHNDAIQQAEKGGATYNRIKGLLAGNGTGVAIKGNKPTVQSNVVSGQNDGCIVSTNDGYSWYFYHQSGESCEYNVEKNGTRFNSATTVGGSNFGRVGCPWYATSIIISNLMNKNIGPWGLADYTGNTWNGSRLTGSSNSGYVSGGMNWSAMASQINSNLGSYGIHAEYHNGFKDSKNAIDETLEKGGMVLFCTIGYWDWHHTDGEHKMVLARKSGDKYYLISSSDNDKLSMFYNSPKTFSEIAAHSNGADQQHVICFWRDNYTAGHAGGTSGGGHQVNNSSSNDASSKTINLNGKEPKSEEEAAIYLANSNAQTKEYDTNFWKAHEDWTKNKKGKWMNGSNWDGNAVSAITGRSLTSPAGGSSGDSFYEANANPSGHKYSYNAAIKHSGWSEADQETARLAAMLNCVDANTGAGKGYAYTSKDVWVRSDGFVMVGPYVMAAQDTNRKNEMPYGSIIPCSAGMALICDTGGGGGLDLGVSFAVFGYSVKNKMSASELNIPYDNYKEWESKVYSLRDG